MCFPMWGTPSQLCKHVSGSSIMTHHHPVRHPAYAVVTDPRKSNITGDRHSQIPNVKFWQICQNCYAMHTFPSLFNNINYMMSWKYTNRRKLFKQISAWKDSLWNVWSSWEAFSFSKQTYDRFKISVTTLTSKIALHVSILDASHCDRWTWFYWRNEMSCDFSQW
jgi:hypothetical protein